MSCKLNSNALLRVRFSCFLVNDKLISRYIYHDAYLINIKGLIKSKEACWLNGKVLCYGHNDTSSSLVHVLTFLIIMMRSFASSKKGILIYNYSSIISLYSSMVEQNTVNIFIDVQFILRARNEKLSRAV